MTQPRAAQAAPGPGAALDRFGRSSILPWLPSYTATRARTSAWRMDDCWGSCTTEAAPSAQAAIIRAPVPVAHYPALNVCASTAQRIEEIVARIRIRQEAGLPLLSIPKELRRMKQAADATAFEQSADRHRQAVWEEVLGPVRADRGETNWRPTRLMEGLAFQAQVGRIFRERFELFQHHGQK